MLRKGRLSFGKNLRFRFGSDCGSAFLSRRGGPTKFGLHSYPIYLVPIDLPFFHRNHTFGGCYSFGAITRELLIDRRDHWKHSEHDASFQESATAVSVSRYMQPDRSSHQRLHTH